MGTRMPTEQFNNVLAGQIALLNAIWRNQDLRVGQTKAIPKNKAKNHPLDSLERLSVHLPMLVLWQDCGK